MMNADTQRQIEAFAEAWAGAQRKAFDGAISNFIENLRALNLPQRERLACPAEMEPGGWVRFPGTSSFRLIDSVNVGHPSETCIHWEFGGQVFPYNDVNPWDTLPYRTAAEHQADCAREDDGLDRLLHAEWAADR